MLPDVFDEIQKGTLTHRKVDDDGGGGTSEELPWMTDLYTTIKLFGIDDDQMNWHL